MTYDHLRAAVNPASQPAPEGATLTPALYNLLCTLADKSDFFGSLRRQYAEKGHLTERQIACIEREQAKRSATLQAVDVGALEAAFARARVNGIAQPRMNLGAYRFQCSANAGAIYVKQDGAYLGKIVQGAWSPTAEGAPHSPAIAALLADPTASALAYGQRTGRCAVCARLLTAAESINRTIGPICAQKYGLI